MGRLFTAARFLIYVGVWVVVWYFALDLLLGVLMPLIQRRWDTTTVPKLTHMDVDKARAVARERGLKAIVDTTVPSLNAPAGTVIGQEPPPGTTVKKGRTVYLTAVRSLEDVGFNVKVEPIYTMDEEPGYVMRMYPPPGSSVPIGSTVTLYYSEEPPDSVLFGPDTTESDTTPP